ncbi:MAG: indolepyruvate ferredoxin oxidoreductase subunit alpha, partial [Planctomycetota bacterium]
MGKKQEILLGNGAVARGLIENGCHFVASYPGTPSSEILPELVRFVKEENLNVYTEWSVNEKVAYDNALAASYTGLRAAVCMKQVGLNVAADSLLSSAYTGIKGGFVIISCDDPGPHSSQTEQDSRFFAMFAKVPAFDPASAQEAKELLNYAFEISEKFEIPVLFRPSIRVCHARQNIRFGKVKKIKRVPQFDKNPSRWAATPAFRYLLHKNLNEKLEKISEEFETFEGNFQLGPKGKSGFGIIAAGIPASIVIDILEENNLIKNIPVLKITTAYPLPVKTVNNFIKRCQKVLVLEETDSVIELQIRDKSKISGRMDGTVPNEGELVPEVIYDILVKAFSKSKLKTSLKTRDLSLEKKVRSMNLRSRRPTLCPGCGHRAAFYAIRKAFPKAIYTSDIGCYTLGLNLGAVDTCLDMGAAITFASGFHHAFKSGKINQPVIATIGDSTFYHSGTTGLTNAVYNEARIVVVILDNSITAMTGMQPTPDSGILANGSCGSKVPLKELVRGCGVQYIAECDPYDIRNMITVVKDAVKYTESHKGGVAVIIANHPCIIAFKGVAKKNRVPVKITDKCTGCKYCIKFFECPALQFDEVKKKVVLDKTLCISCGVCVSVCTQKAIEKD